MPFQFVPTMADMQKPKPRPAALPQQGYRPTLPVQPQGYPTSVDMGFRPEQPLKQIGHTPVRSAYTPPHPTPQFGATGATPIPTTPKAGWGEVPKYQPQSPAQAPLPKAPVKPSFMGNLKAELSKPGTATKVAKFGIKNLSKVGVGAIASDMLFPQEANAGDDVNKIKNYDMKASPWRQNDSNPSGIPKPAFGNTTAQGGATAPWENSAPRVGVSSPSALAPVGQPAQAAPATPAKPAAPKYATPTINKTVAEPEGMYPTTPAAMNPIESRWAGLQGQENMRTLVDSADKPIPLDATMNTNANGYKRSAIGSMIDNTSVPMGGGIASNGDETVMLRGGNSVPQAENDAVIAQREKNYGPQPTLVGGAGGVVNAMPGQSIAEALSPVGTTIDDAIAHRRGLQERELSGREGLQHSQIGLNASTVNKNNIEAREMPLNNASEREARSIQGQSALGHLGVAQQMVQPNIDAINNQTAMTNETIDQNRIMRPLEATAKRQAIDNFVGKGELQQNQIEARQEQQIANMIAEAHKLPTQEQIDFALDNIAKYQQGLTRQLIAPKKEAVPGRFFGMVGKQPEQPAEYDWRPAKSGALPKVAGM